jgi:hypothetical protein
LDVEMSLTAAPRATGSAAWADALLLSFAQAGYSRAEPAILQPAEPFLDLSGEDIRKSLYLTTDAGGEELCLRPDLTIPVARDYLASAEAGQPAGFSYLGPVFRYRGGQPSEFLQAGIESFGRQDRAAADAEMLALALEATSRVRPDRGRNPHRRRRAVHGADRRARSLPGVAAAADQGFQPQDQPGAGYRALTLATGPAATNMRACSPRWRVPTARRRWRW